MLSTSHSLIFGDEGACSTDSSLIDKSNMMETPLGDRDRREKVQLCIELRKEVKSKKTLFHLDVVVMQIKYLRPVNPTMLPAPYVKLRLLPDNVIMSTDLKENEKKDIYFYGEPFTFSVNKNSDLKGKSIHVQVCDKKVTRHAHSFGEVTIPLDNYQVEKPSVQWYYLGKEKEQ